MGKDGDEIISLPNPPPPNPAARREAIDAALRKFDGIEEPAPRQAPSRIRWGAMNRRPAGALIAATLIAVIAIPAIQLGLPDRPTENAVSEQPAPDASITPPGINGVPQAPPAEEPLATPDQPSPAQVDAVAATPKLKEEAAPAPASPRAERENLGRLFANDSAQKAKAATPERIRAVPAPPPVMSAPPPPAPPPPPAEAQEMADEGGARSIVVTGTRTPAPANLESASPVTVITTTSIDFLSMLRAALDDNDRRAVIRLVAIPLRVNFNGGTKTYRSSKDIERDYNRIFTPAVREAIADLEPYDLQKRDGGRLRGGDRIWFGCGKNVCRDEGAIRVREVTP